MALTIPVVANRKFLTFRCIEEPEKTFNRNYAIEQK